MTGIFCQASFNERMELISTMSDVPASLSASVLSARYADPQSQRDCVSQPRVARNELPWVRPEKDPQPQRGCGHTHCSHRIMPQPFQGWIHCPPFPRVARSSQPWALCRNPVGILLFIGPWQMRVRSRIFWGFRRLKKSARGLAQSKTYRSFPGCPENSAHEPTPSPSQEGSFV